MLHVIGFQKRGLPYAHILVILKEEDMMREPDQVDQLVRAEIPDPETELELYAIVTKTMMHGPCVFNPNALYVREENVVKDFLKHFQSQQRLTLKKQRCSGSNSR